ncbi:hypothetical protein Pcinc_008095 [Petrolisthes cinctipes]|uniref:Uncharacterized protein n=1 Tax=Petrolisthes cinctipes TaxID=88211 RepID=A0AAE1G9K8_PETCI|nr:hypothetical protein Pcinc_008095 [Petrolisthes cinctipes]
MLGAQLGLAFKAVAETRVTACQSVAMRKQGATWMGVVQVASLSTSHLTAKLRPTSLPRSLLSQPWLLPSLNKGPRPFSIPTNSINDGPTQYPWHGPPTRAQRGRQQSFLSRRG